MSSSRTSSLRSRGRLRRFSQGIVPGIVRYIVTAGVAGLRRPELALRRELWKRATSEAADIVSNEMPDALFCENRFVNLDYALSLRRPGLILEFGVAKGASITHIAATCPQDRIYGFDSFHGLPEHWSGNRFSYRNFDQKGVLPKVPANVELVPGLFSDTLPSFLEKHPETVGFLHIDCDIYSSTKYILGALSERLLPGTVIVFDELFNYPGFRLHEYRAFREFVAEPGRKYRFVSFAGTQASVVLET